jgi:hypothetical protein
MDEVIFALNQAVPRSSELVDTEPSLQSSSTALPMASTTPGPFHHPSYPGPTTLGSSASESMATIPGGKRSSSWMAYVALLGVAAAASFFIFRAVLQGDGEDKAAPTAGSAAVAVAPVGARRDAGEASDERPVIKPIESEGQTVTLTIESDPDGARVYRESDGVRIGTTPVHYQVRKGTGEMGFIIKRRGFRSQELTMGVDRDDAFMVKLLRRRAGEPDAPEKVNKAAASSNAEPRKKKEGEGAGSGTASSSDGGGDERGKHRGPRDPDAPIDPFKFAPQ